MVSRVTMPIYTVCLILDMRILALILALMIALMILALILTDELGLIRANVFYCH